MKITASVSKSSHQDRGPCYLHLRIFSYTYTLLFWWKIKSRCDRCFPQQNENIIVRELVAIQQTTHTACSNTCNLRRRTTNADVNVEANR